MTNHMWDGFWFLANKQGVGRRCRPTCARSSRPSSTPSAVDERDDIAKLNETVGDDAEGQGPAVRRHRCRRLPRRAEEGRLLQGVEGQVRRPRRGACWRRPSAACRNAVAGARHSSGAHARQERHWSGALPAVNMIARIETGCAPPWKAPRRRWCWPRSSCCWPAWSAASSSTIRSSGRRARLDPVPVARHAGRRDRAAAQRAHAADRRGQPLLGRAARRMSRCWRSWCRRCSCSCCCRSSIEYAADECYIETPGARPVQHRARRRDPGRRAC